MSTRSLVWSLPFGRREVRPHNRVTPLVRGSHRGSRFKAWRHYVGQYTTAALIGAVGILLIAYVFGINQSAAKGYEITKQRNKLNSLLEDNKKLMVRTAEVGSILQIQDDAAANHLVQITNQEYLQITQLSQR